MPKNEWSIWVRVWVDLATRKSIQFSSSEFVVLSLSAHATSHEYGLLKPLTC